MPREDANYDESRVPDYTLPALLNVDGTEITTAREWEGQGRASTLQLFEQHVFGETLGKAAASFVVTSQGPALGGLAVRKEVDIFIDAAKTQKIALLIYLPANAAGPVPVFLGLNFRGNQSIHPDPEITLSRRWTAGTASDGYDDGYAQEASRGLRHSRWPVEQIIERGYGLATAYYGDLQLDRKDIDERADSFHRWFEREYGVARKADSWGAIGIWAWQLSRCLDYLLQDADVDGSKVAAIGHSRLGKTALWAAAQDTRFAMAISNDSGEGGAALMKRRFGETVEIITTSFPHWFNGRFPTYSDNEDALPVDSHQLIALLAPRPVYVASAAEDLWADPKGEYLGIVHASPVYALYGQQTLDKSTFPEIGQALSSGKMGYHRRAGKHDITLIDWERYLDFADAQWR